MESLSSIEKYINRKLWSKIARIYIAYNDSFLLKIVSFGYKPFYRNYFIHIEFKDGTSNRIKISKSDKSEVKKKILEFNFHIHNSHLSEK
ncbi:MAG: hypothetical protein ACPGU5_06485 [Lishizhenia sp.]